MSLIEDSSFRFGTRTLIVYSYPNINISKGEYSVKHIDNVQFQSDLLNWYDENKRDLPWRKENDPYKIWVSEIMLQQTQVDTVIPYYERFMTLFPTLQDLAEAEEETVLKAWEGLGYYSRARNLHTAVKEVAATYGGQVPDTPDEVQSLRGVGPYTAGAILSIAYNIPAPAVDGNVMRVISRLYTIYDDISRPSARHTFEMLVMKLISQERASDFNQALMELGALICTPRQPACLLCPVQSHCAAREEGVQEILPVKAKKKPPKKLQMKVAVVKDEEGKILIEKRPETGLLAKLWQFPNIEAVTDTNDDLKAHLSALGVEVSLAKDAVQEVRHVFTHIVWEMEVYTATMTKLEETVFSGATTRLFVDRDDISYYPFPVSHQKIIDHSL
ncbi:A/G-specific adenine glycosylase [Salipaludibacillus agaradhaerens]|uniref:Adenine DNA glycosylase n=1 Tax=Salipaludibacillus agaradhaerens TaxID=76935 RepID=A0A9Q4FZA9_SALAG|nr:A/G-specific adenine glycosylase [Salipaludibacillus agaradhaerens]MCR6097216.1 A/G-specific adenine glycosylase [Salipaludibacillus agaradhaerens]MCR6113299.1 A/G-specific adenine glycosylase [Salipaludibacillus agaradhaerens]